VKALPIADEPFPFWDGSDADERIDRWRQETGVDADAHGTFSAPGRLNGSSGRWLDEHVLAPHGISRDKVWTTDCLDTYRMSNGVETRLRNTYVAGRPRYGWPSCDIEPHPIEPSIVQEALRSHRDRLRWELDRCQPELVVTLGNAACRVLHELSGIGPRRLETTNYGQEQKLSIGGHDAVWLPLAHPAAPQRYQLAHQSWKARR
jgi:uracil-DNA glycosylase